MMLYVLLLYSESWPRHRISKHVHVGISWSWGLHNISKYVRLAAISTICSSGLFTCLSYQMWGLKVEAAGCTLPVIIVHLLLVEGVPPGGIVDLFSVIWMHNSLCLQFSSHMVVHLVIYNDMCELFDCWPWQSHISGLNFTIAQHHSRYHKCIFAKKLTA